MTAKRGNQTGDPAHPRKTERRSHGKKKPAEHAPVRHDPGEHRIDESVEESFPASDPPAHGVDPEVHVKDAPVEGEREPDDDEGGIGGELRRPQHEGEDVDPLERGED